MFSLGCFSPDRSGAKHPTDRRPIHFRSAWRQWHAPLIAAPMMSSGSTDLLASARAAAHVFGGLWTQATTLELACA
jgi:hypothetical protein